jgi:hypothetical protein
VASPALPDPPVQRYPFADARCALRAIADRQATGTVVLSRQTQNELTLLPPATAALDQARTDQNPVMPSVSKIAVH